LPLDVRHEFQSTAHQLADEAAGLWIRQGSIDVAIADGDEEFLVGRGVDDGFARPRSRRVGPPSATK
jgi:hypothetical protein